MFFFIFLVIFFTLLIINSSHAWIFIVFFVDFPVEREPWTLSNFGTTKRG